MLDGERRRARRHRIRECPEEGQHQPRAVWRDVLRQPDDDAVVIDGAKLVVVPAVGAALHAVGPQLRVVVPLPAPTAGAATAPVRHYAAPPPAVAGTGSPNRAATSARRSRSRSYASSWSRSSTS